MIVVKNGFTMQEHAPITYNYRYQSVPSPVSRTSIYPLDQYDPPNILPAATTDTGYPVYLTSQMAVGTIGGNTSIDCYLSWRSSSGSNKHEQITNEQISASSGYDIRFIHNDGYSYTSKTVGSEEPITFAFIADTIGFYLWTGAHPMEYTASGVRVAYKYVKNGIARVSTAYIFNNERYNDVRITQTGRHTQQDLVYTVTGGVVTP